MKVRSVVLVLWLVFCLVMTYQQLGQYILLFVTEYGVRYFPFLEGLL